MEENKIQENVNTTEEMTVFGKIDRKIVANRQAKAEKKAKKAAEKAAKKESKEETSTEKKKFNPVAIIAVGGAVLGAVGTVIAKGAIDRANATCELEDGEILEENAAIPEKTESETVES